MLNELGIPAPAGVGKDSLFEGVHTACCPDRAVTTGDTVGLTYTVYECYIFFKSLSRKRAEQLLQYSHLLSELSDSAKG